MAHISLPDELRTGYGALNVPGVGQIPFGHNRFEGGVLIYAEFQPGRSMLGTIEYGSVLPEDAPELTIDELRDEREAGGRGRPAGGTAELGRGRTPCGGSMVRTPVRPRSTAPAMSSWWAMPPTSIRRWAGPALNLGMQDAMNLGWKLAAAVQGMGAGRLAGQLSQ